MDVLEICSDEDYFKDRFYCRKDKCTLKRVQIPMTGEKRVVAHLVTRHNMAYGEAWWEIEKARDHALV